MKSVLSLFQSGKKTSATGANNTNIVALPSDFEKLPIDVQTNILNNLSLYELAYLATLNKWFKQLASSILEKRLSTAEVGYAVPKTGSLIAVTKRKEASLFAESFSNFGSTGSSIKVSKEAIQETFKKSVNFILFAEEADAKNYAEQKEVVEDSIRYKVPVFKVACCNNNRMLESASTKTFEIKKNQHSGLVGFAKTFTAKCCNLNKNQFHTLLLEGGVPDQNTHVFTSATKYLAAHGPKLTKPM